MFEELIKELKKLEKNGVPVPVKMDEEGYYDRECPNVECLFQFKVFGEDWQNLCTNEAIHCPLCGHNAPSKSWWTKEQLESGRTQALGQVNAALNRGLAAGARDFNRKQRPGFVTLSMKYSGGPTHHAVVPISAQEAMKLKIQCESCTTRFAVIGSAFFCPCCGFNSVERTFDDSLKKVEVKLNYINEICDALEKTGDRDSAELARRSLIESGVHDCVVAFQKYIETLYIRLPNAAKPSLNVFQRIDDGSKLWKQFSGEGYEDWISPGALADLNIFFHRRHLLAHTEGFVDERYLNKSGDSSYKVGQRIVVREKNVREMVSLIRTLTSIAGQRVRAILSENPIGKADVIP